MMHITITTCNSQEISPMLLIELDTLSVWKNLKNPLEKKGLGYTNNN